MRHRFVKGFNPVALERMRTEIADAMGRQGIAKAAFPVSRAVLMDPAILTSSAFSKPRDIESVPSWRDGAAGKELQLQMVHVLKVRYFEFGFSKQADKVTSVFASGAHWAAVARLLPAVIATTHSKWGSQETSWPDAVQTDFGASVAWKCGQHPGSDAEAIDGAIFAPRPRGTHAG